jgi:hypothetical protein
MAGWEHCKTPEVVAKRVAAIKAAQTEGERKRKSDAAKARWADPDFRERMRQKHRERWTPEYRAARAESQRGRKHTEEHKAHMRRVMVGKNVGKERSEETRQKLSEAGLRAYANGRPITTSRERIYRNSPGWHAGTWFRCLNSEGVAARQMDEAGISWRYEPRRFRLSIGTYTPDFYLPEFDVWLEIKGYLRPGEREKHEAFREETGKTLVLVMQTELESMKYE